MKCGFCYRLLFSSLSVSTCADLQTWMALHWAGKLLPCNNCSCGGGGEWGQGLLVVGLQGMKALEVGVHSPFALHWFSLWLFWNRAGWLFFVFFFFLIYWKTAHVVYGFELNFAEMCCKNCFKMSLFLFFFPVLKETWVILGFQS